jgi:predicted TIM-barrel fold metal-dependent hydrolase
MSGILDEYPKLKLVCPHLGGTLPYIIGRLDHQVKVLKRGPRNLQRSPGEYVRSIWMDVVSPLPLAIKYGHEFIGPDRLLFSSDHPWVEPALIADCVKQARLPAADEVKLFTTNAQKLFRL